MTLSLLLCLVWVTLTAASSLTTSITTATLAYNTTFTLPNPSVTTLRENITVSYGIVVNGSDSTTLTTSPTQTSSLSVSSATNSTPPTQTSSSSTSTTNDAASSSSTPPVSPDDVNMGMKLLLEKGLRDSNMMLMGTPWLRGEFADHGRLFCGINAMTTFSKELGTSFPKCLMELAVNDFCTRKESQKIGLEAGPNRTDHKVGLWSTYKFTGYSVSGLYIGIEILNHTDCQHLTYTISRNTDHENEPDPQCVGSLMQLVTDCSSDDDNVKYGGISTHDTDGCLMRAIYPMSPFANASFGELPPPMDMGQDGIYPGCEKARMAGLPITTGTYLPIASLQWPLPTKTAYTALAKTQDNDYTVPSPTSAATASGEAKRARSVQYYPGDSPSGFFASTSSSVAIETSEPASVTPSEPGNRELTRA